jgi:hypothetical protein
VSEWGEWGEVVEWFSVGCWLLAVSCGHSLELNDDSKSTKVKTERWFRFEIGGHRSGGWTKTKFTDTKSQCYYSTAPQKGREETQPERDRHTDTKCWAFVGKTQSTAMRTDLLHSGVDRCGVDV